MNPPRFRTIELSDPAYEADHLRHVTVKTPNLIGRGDITVYTPAGFSNAGHDLPIVTLLHGVYGSHWAWAFKAGVHRTAQQMIDAGEIAPMLIAMPSDGLMFDGSAYLPHNRRRFDAWIVDDVPDALMESGFPTSVEAPRFIAGLSMGGFGALRLGAAFPERYRAFAGHSSITALEQMKLFIEEDLGVFDAGSEEFNVLDTMRGAGGRLPPFRFDCGTEDELIEYNRDLHGSLEALGIPHIYEEYPGGHGWEYWTVHVRATLRFFSQQLTASRGKRENPA